MFNYAADKFTFNIQISKFGHSVRRRRKKHRLVVEVEVESLASSSKKNTKRRREDGGKVDEHLIKILGIYLQQ